MKKSIFISFIILVNLANCQNKNIDKVIVEKINSIGILEAPFVIDEIIEAYPKDTLIIKRIYNRKIFDRTPSTLYCYDVSADFFYKKLIEKQSEIDNMLINKILSDLVYDKIIDKPKIDWSNVFKTCLSCPFGEYPDERFFYFNFSLLHMGVEEIKEMISYSNGQQWNYALMAIKGGDSFTLYKEEDYIHFIIDRRIASYIIERWKDSEIPEVQQLIEVYRSVM